MVVSDLTEDLIFLDHASGSLWKILIIYIGFQYYPMTHKAIIKTEWDIANESYGYRLD